MGLSHIRRAAFGLAAVLLLCSIGAFGQSVSSVSQASRFDGKWLTKLTCPAKGNTEGYTWEFGSVIQSGSFRGERGVAGEPGYLLIEGKIGDNGAGRLSATGVVASRKYARGIFAHKGEEYSYNIKAQFQDMEGTGTRDTGLGVVGRPCTFDFVRQQPAE